MISTLKGEFGETCCCTHSFWLGFLLIPFWAVIEKVKGQKFSLRIPRSLVISALINTPITAKHEIFKHPLIVEAGSSACAAAAASGRDICFQLAPATDGCLIYEIEIELFSLIKFVLANNGLGGAKRATTPVRRPLVSVWTVARLCARLSKFCCDAIALD